MQEFPLDRVVEETQLPAESIERLAELIGRPEKSKFDDGPRRVSLWWTMGVNQSYQGVRTAQAIINLALMTGNIGRPGTGANSITGQCNAMGSRLFSNTTNLLGGHDFANAAHREKIAGILDIDAEQIPCENSWPYHRIIDGILRGKIRGLWVICTNPAHSWINQSQCRDILDRLDFLVVQDMYHSTETARMADLILPAAGWGEKEGTFINSERRIGRIRQVARAPGEALSDFRIFQLVAEYWGCGEMFRKWDSPESVFRILRECSQDQPCDFTGIDGYRSLEEQGGIQWPCPKDASLPVGRASRPVTETSETDNTTTASPTTPEDQSTFPESQRRLFADGTFYHPDGRARFLFDPPRGLSEPPTAQFPFILLTGRGSASQWHTQTRTAKSPVLRRLYPENPFVEINPVDARSLGIQQNAWVTIESQRGTMRARAFLTNAIRTGQLFIPMHYEETNRLTDAVFDPHSAQPSYKSCAVRLQ